MATEKPADKSKVVHKGSWEYSHAEVKLLGGATKGVGVAQPTYIWKRAIVTEWWWESDIDIKVHVAGGSELHAKESERTFPANTMPPSFVDVGQVDNARPADPTGNDSPNREAPDGARPPIAKEGEQIKYPSGVVVPWLNGVDVVPVIPATAQAALSLAQQMKASSSVLNEANSALRTLGASSNQNDKRTAATIHGIIDQAVEAVIKAWKG